MDVLLRSTVCSLTLSLKIRPVGAEMLHANRHKNGRADGQTERHEAKSRFSQFSKRASK